MCCVQSIHTVIYENFNFQTLKIYIFCDSVLIFSLPSVIINDRLFCNSSLPSDILRNFHLFYPFNQASMWRQWSTRISPLLFGMLVARTKSDRCGDTTSQTHRWIFSTLETTSLPCKTDIPFSFCKEWDERAENLCSQPCDSLSCMYELCLHVSCFVIRNVTAIFSFHNELLESLLFQVVNLVQKLQKFGRVLQNTEL